MYTWRRFGVLLRGLPADAMFARLIARDTPPSGAPDMNGWPLTDRLLAVIADTLLAANWQRGGGKGKRPRLFDGDAPATPQHRKPAVDPAKARQILARISGKDLTHG